MPSEMRRPAITDVDAYVDALDERLRSQVGRTRRWSLPDAVRHPLIAMKTVTRPLIQSGAMVLTALAVIIAVGAAPATVKPADSGTPLGEPTVSTDFSSGVVAFSEKIPTEDLLAVRDTDIVDTSALAVE